MLGDMQTPSSIPFFFFFWFRDMVSVLAKQKESLMSFLHSFSSATASHKTWVYCCQKTFKSRLAATDATDALPPSTYSCYIL